MIPFQPVSLGFGFHTFFFRCLLSAATGASVVAAGDDAVALSRPPNGDARAHWQQVAADARSYREAHPGDPRVRSTRGLELQAQIELQDDQAESPETAAAVEAYLADRQNPVRDRLSLEIVADQATLRRQHYPSRRARTEAHATHARKLIAAFPDQPEGYGYLLSLAKISAGDQARSLATELLGSAASPDFRAAARRILDRQDLAGRPLELDDAIAQAALGAAKGHLLAVYTWTADDPGFVELVSLMAAKDGDARFLGINLDRDRGIARAAAEKLRPPGDQIYDGGGLEGALATQLHVVLTESLLFVDASGRVRDVDGADDAWAKFAELANQGGAR